jgi:hypothetical protein
LIHLIELLPHPIAAAALEGPCDLIVVRLVNA